MEVNFPIDNINLIHKGYFSRLSNNRKLFHNHSKVGKGLTNYASQTGSRLSKFILACIAAFTLNTSQAKANDTKQLLLTEVKPRIENFGDIRNKERNKTPDWILYFLTAVGIIGSGLGMEAISNAVVRKREKQKELEEKLQKLHEDFRNHMQNDEMYRIHDRLCSLELGGQLLSLSLYMAKLEDVWRMSLPSVPHPLEGLLSSEEELKELDCPRQINCYNLRNELENWISKLETGDREAKITEKNDYYNRTLYYIQKFLVHFYSLTTFNDALAQEHYTKCKSNVFDYIDKMESANSDIEQFEIRSEMTNYIRDEIYCPTDLIEKYHTRLAQLRAEKIKDNENILES